MPQRLAGSGVERDQRARVQIVALAFAAPEIRRRRADRGIDDAASFVGHHRRPHVRRAGAQRAVVLPGGVGGIGLVARNRVELPALRTGADIEREDRARRCVGSDVVHDRRADRDDVRDDHGRRNQLRFRRILIRPVLHHLYGATPAEIGTGPARPRVERDHARIIRAHEDPHGTGGAGLCAGITPHRHATAGVLVRQLLHERDLGVIYPLLAPRRRIERNHAIERRAEHEGAVDEDRRDLGRAVGDVVRPAPLHLAGGVAPRDFQVRDVATIDLPGGREPGTAGVAAVMRPACRVVRRGAGSNQQQASREQ